MNNLESSIKNLQRANLRLRFATWQLEHVTKGMTELHQIIKKQQESQTPFPDPPSKEEMLRLDRMWREEESHEH